MQGRNLLKARTFRTIRRSRIAVCLAAPAILATTAVGCLDRPIETAEPRTTSTIVEQLSQSRVDKIDLLLAIDNSGSMADKQQILADAVPDLVEGLVNPRCLDEAGAIVANQPKGPLELCPDGSRREFPPVLDIHIGIITSSLGDYGGAHCPQNADKNTFDDKAHLIARSTPLAQNDVPTYQGAGFLAWDPKQKLDPKGEKEIGTLEGSTGLIPTLREMVKGVGQVGCGYEAQLESWYRFLVDPEPYLEVAVNGANKSVAVDLDKVLLEQRAEFMRPDSLLAILMLSDENDCSINEVGVAHIATRATPLPRMRQECSANPNDACCAPCGEAPPGCAADATCDLPMSVPDHANLRCFDQKNRYGYDFLHPIDRYVAGLTKDFVPDRAGNLVPNPIFSDLNPKDKITQIRSKNLVFSAGIAGVPWQDIARDPADLTKGFKDAKELGEKNEKGWSAWDLIVGDPANGTKPLDPFMIESADPRQGGTNPVTGDSILQPGSEMNAINGHEWITSGKDLQFACTLPLPASRDCTKEIGCDCDVGSPPNPLCEKDASGANTKFQERAKAFPSTRQLEVLKGLGPQGIVASVCAKQVDDRARPDYGYRPAIGALIDQLKTALGHQCLPRTLTPDENKQVSCLILEARATNGGECSCDAAKARMPVDPLHEPAVQEALRDENADAAGWDCFCEIPQLEEKELDVCQTDTSISPQLDGEPVNGWCYVDATTSPTTGEPKLVEQCADTEKRMIRFVGKGEVQPSGTLFITCAGE